MALTSAQITLAFQNVLQRDPSAAELAAWLNASTSGALTDAQVYAAIVSSAEAQNGAAAIIRVYQAAFGRVPDKAGLDQQTDSFMRGGFTINKIAEGFVVSQEFANKYNGGVLLADNAAAVTDALLQSLYQNVLGRLGSAAEIAAWKATLTTPGSGYTKASDILIGFSQSPEFVGKAATAVSTFLTAAAQGTAVYSGALLDPAAGSGSTFTLTTGVDTVVGTANGDTINGGTLSTLSAFDSIDGGAGTDTLTALIATATMPGSATITNVENVNILTTGAGFTIDTTTGYAGLTKLSVKESGGGAVSVTSAATTAVTAETSGAFGVTVVGSGGDLSVKTGAGAVAVGATAVANALTSATVNGGTTVAITDRSGAAAATGSTLKTVTVNGNAASDDIAITANGITALNLSGLKGATAVGDTVITAAAGTRALTLTLNGVDTAGDGAATAGGFTVTDATATTLNIKSTGTATYDVTTVAGAATAVTVDAAAALDLDAITAGVATTLGISGASKVTIGNQTLAAAAVITSTNTGGVTLSTALAAGQQYVGTASSGVDTIGVATGWTKAITTGAGNDVVTYGGPAGSGGTIDAGDGTGDTIKMTAAQAVTATGSTTFAGTVSNFEVLEISATTGAAAAINMANADGINQLVLNGVDTGALTVTNAAANFSYTNKSAVTFASSISLASDTGTSDTVNVTYTANDGFADTTAMTIANVENINIVTKDANTTAQTTQFTAIITAPAVKSVVISGDTGVVFTNTATTITSLDASGLTSTVAAAGGLTWTTGVLAEAATIKGGAAATNTVNFAAATKAVTYTGGTGIDAITANNSNNTINTGDGNDAITLGNGNNTVSAGAGDDTVTLGTGANTVDLGAGTNTVVTGGVMNGLNVITFGAGVDTFDVNHVSSAAGFYPSIKGIAAGDKIDLVGAGVGTVVAEATLGAAVALGGASSFANFLDAATAGNATAATNAVVNWFQFNGNTYVVLDNSNNNTYTDGVDLVIELQGLVTLTNSTLAAEVITIV
jgi:S-layer protein